MSEAKPIPAATEPMAVDLKEGEAVWWCACGRSKNQPYCDGSHAGTGLTPVEYVPKRSKTYYFCACKQTKRSPLCDGSHNSL